MLGEKPVPASLYPLHIPHTEPYDRTQVARNARDSQRPSRDLGVTAFFRCLKEIGSRHAVFNLELRENPELSRMMR
jgi:hypothetical protein